MMSNRDNFTRKTKNAVAARAGWHCTLEGCNKPTVGPSDEAPDAVAIIGIAAHICAAAPGGRRYDASMTPDERSGFDNAIWLCADHATLIDRDEVTYTADLLRGMKRKHEAARTLAMRVGSSANLAGLVALGGDVVFTGELINVEAATWTVSLKHFLIGDVQQIISFIDAFAGQRRENNFVLSNELGDGRVLVAAPSLKKQADGYVLICAIEPSAARVDVQNIGSGWAAHPETNDLHLDKKGGIARLSGADYFPQRIREVLSMQRGESAFSPNFGVRFFEYFEAYRGTPWLDLLFKLDLIRQASIPSRDGGLGKTYTPLQCVSRVYKVEILAETPTNNRLPVRVDLDVQGIGLWTKELSIYMPTAQQMAERGKMIAEMPWLDCAVRDS